MAVEFIEYKVVVNTANGEAKFELLDKSIKQTEQSTKQLNSTINQTNKNLGQTANKSGLAGAAVVEIGRTISDANYGMMAMANNLQQVATLMITLISTSGGVTKGFKLLFDAFKGPLGLIVVFQSFIALIERADKKQRELKNSSNGIAQAYGEAAADLRIFVNLMSRSTTTIDEKQRMIKALNDKYEDLNVQMDENGELTRQSSIDIAAEIEMLKLKAETQAIVTEITKLYGEEAKTLAMSNAEFVGFYEYLTAKIKGGDITQSISQAIDMLASFGSAVPYSLPADDIGLLSDTAQTERETKIEDIKKRIEGLIGRLPDEVYEVLFGEKKKGTKDKAKKRAKALGVDPITGESYDAQMEARRKFFTDLFNLDEQNNKALQEAGKAGVDEFLDSQIVANAQRFESQRIVNEMLTEDERLAAEKRKEIRELEQEQAIMTYQAIGDGLTSLGDIIGKETAAGKAFAAAGALIDTYAAITAILKNTAKTPAGGIPGFAIAQAVATGLFGLAQVKKILSVQVPGGKGGGGSSGSIATPTQAPTFNIVGTSGASQLREAVEGGLNRPIKAYVTQKDISTSAELERSTRKTASII